MHFADPPGYQCSVGRAGICNNGHFRCSPLFPGFGRFGARTSAPIVLLAVALCGCSFDLGSWSSAPEKEAPKVRTNGARRAHRGRAGICDAGPGAGKVRQDRGGAGRVRQGDHHRSASCRRAVQPWPALSARTAASARGRRLHLGPWSDAATGRTVAGSRHHLSRDGQINEAVADLDEAVQADPQAHWHGRPGGQAYERLGERRRPRPPMAVPLAIRPRDDAARSGLARLGG